MSSSWKLESSQTTQASSPRTPSRPESGRPDVAGDRNALPRGAEDRAEQLARGGLPVRPGHAQDRVREEAETKLDLAPDRQPTLARGGREGGRRRNSWAFHEQVHAVEKLGVVRAEDDFDTRLAKPPRVDVLALVDADDGDTPPCQRERRRLSRAGQAENERSVRKPSY